MLFVIDFDSTFVRSESLEELAEIVLKKKKGGAAVMEQIAQLTAAGMNGTLPFEESLKRRLGLLKPSRTHIKLLAALLKRRISHSVKRNKPFFREHADSIYIVTGGFREFVAPAVEQYGIRRDHILANTFTFDAQGRYTGYDNKNPLARGGGKAAALSALKLKGPVLVIGDGYTDYEIKKRNPSFTFVAYTENVRRESVVQYADHVAPGFDEILYHFGYRTSTSYPKNRIKVLLLENIHPSAVSAFEKEGYSVETEKRSLPEPELRERLKGVNILGIRSRTRIGADTIAHAGRLLAVGTFCIGTDQIALADAAGAGVAVFNAPYSNTRSVVELVLGEIIMLARGVLPKSIQLHGGTWNKSALGSFEVRGKTLGIIGYGNIGSQLGILAENLGMRIIFYDIAEKLALGNAQQVYTLRELLRKSDIVTVHVDGRKSNKGLIGAKEFSMMKKGVLFLNASRGFVVDDEALAAAVRGGHVAAAAIDVFPREPADSSEPFESPLCGLHNVILTPHIAGSTQEAQENIARFVSTKLIEYINTGNTVLSVNMPQIAVPHGRGIHRFLHIHRNVPGMLAAINTVFAQHNINIIDQILKTDGAIGYAVTDVSKGYEQAVNKALADIPHTIRSRSIYL